MKRSLISPILILFLATVSFAQSKDAASSRRCKAPDDNTARLLFEYQELRARRLRQAQGAHDKDLDDYQGRLHQVLSALGTRLGQPPFTVKLIKNCLGAPDAKRRGAQMNRFLGIYDRQKGVRVPQHSDDLEYLIYFWRGWHDFLFFISKDGRILDHGWWLAYE